MEDELEKLKPTAMPADMQSWTIEDLESHKRTGDYRIRRLEEDLEAEKELRLEAKKEMDESKEDYENVMQNLMAKMKETEEEADAKVDEIMNENSCDLLKLKKVVHQKKGLSFSGKNKNFRLQKFTS